MDGRKIVGVIITIIGVVLLLNALEFIDVSVGQIISNYWPLILVAIGLFNIISNPASKTGGFIMVTIGVLFQLRVLGYFDVFQYNIVWPIIIIFIGLRIVLPKRFNQPLTNDTFNAFAMFSGSEVRSSSGSFKGGSATALFGGAEIDLREARIEEGQEAVIDVFAAFGGIEIRVPEEWNVVVSGIPIFGGITNKSMSKNPDGPILKINGTALFGGVEIM